MDNMKGAATSQSSKVQFPLHMGIGTLMTKAQPQLSRRPKSMKSQLWGSDNHGGSSKNSKWIQENLEELDYNVKRMVKLIEEEDVDSSTRKKPGHNQKKPELIHLVDELSRMYRSLADQYNHATGDVRKNIPSDLLTPDFFQLPGGHSTDGSSYHEYYESESDESSVVNSSAVVHPNEDEHKMLALEEELKNTKEKLRDSENEAGRLMKELNISQKSEQALQSQLETVMDQALKLADHDQQIRRQKEEITNVEKSYHQEEMRKLENERTYLEKKVNELEVWYQSLEENVAEKSLLEVSLREEIRLLREEIRLLKEEITNADISLSQVKTYHQEEMMKLEIERSHLENKVTELDMVCQSLAEDVRQVQTEKSVLEASLGAEIEQLRTAVSEKIDQLNEISQDYKTVMDEKDKLNARVEEFIVETRSKDDRLNEMHLECLKMTQAAGGSREKVEKLRERVEELEEKVGKQEVIILEEAEKKREAIRQLCFSLEHYRVGYQELRESILSHKRLPAAVAF